MTDIRTFKGLLYDGDKISNNYSKVVAPPYDVIPDSMRDALYEKDPHNIVRLILGKTFDSDSADDNRYVRAKMLLDDWQTSGVLSKDNEEAFYIYVQEYEFAGQKCRRVGFLGLTKIGETGDDAVMPHEYTLSKPKEDRFNLIKEVKCNLSPIFTLYDDVEGVVKPILDKVISGSDPIVDFVLDGESHKLWRLTDKTAIEKITTFMKTKKVFIADGHHRYEVAKTYRNAKREEKDYNGGADYVLTYYSDLSDSDNLTVVATHRAIKVMPDETVCNIEAKFSECFDIEECNDLSALMDRMSENLGTNHVFGFLNSGKYLFLKPKNKNGVIDLIDGEKTLDWKSLDVSALHSAVLGKILAVDNVEGNITYVKKPEEAEALVADGSHMAAFLLNPTKVGQMKLVAEHGEMMPQKSTYFLPKLLSGMVVNKFD